MYCNAKMRLLRRPLILLTLILMVACTPSRGLEPPIAPAATTVATATQAPTSVPATATPNPTATSSPEPTATPSPEPSATPANAMQFEFEGISLTLNPEIVATIYPSFSEEDQEIVFRFAEDGYCVLDGCILFTEMDALSQVNSDKMAEVETAVAAQDDSYIFKTAQVALVLQSHTSLLSSKHLQGIRAVTFKTQTLPLISNGALTYEFRGVTTDGRYFVQAWIPVSLPFLPDSGDPGQENQPHFAVPLPELTTSDEDVLFEILEAYNAEVAVFVHAASEDTFTPDLAAIDALIQSIALNVSTDD